ncbi:hypothetical protein M405DRAFT_832162, partial [Rhizopogon salebrosus TDB-379]
MSSCVRAPYRTSESRAASSDCARRTVRAYLSDIPNFNRVLPHPTLYAVASHKVLAFRIPGAHRSRVVPPVTGPRPRATNFHGRL